MEKGDGNWKSAKGGKKEKYPIMESSNFMRTQYAISHYQKHPIVIFNTLLDEYSDQEIDFELPSGIQKYLSNLLIEKVFDSPIDLELPYLDASLFSINQTQLRGLFRKKGFASCDCQEFSALELCQQTIKSEEDSITLAKKAPNQNKKSTSKKSNTKKQAKKK